MRPDDSKFATVPVGKLGIIVHPSCAELGKRIDQYIVNWRKEREHEHKENVVFKDYEQDTYIIDATCSRFGTGEAKALISDSVRGVDLYILADVLNYSLKYKVCGHENHMSPDDIYADVKRIIGAASGKPKSITVIMPFLYESRQHKRSSRESLDCAYALQELTAIGVDNVLPVYLHKIVGTSGNDVGCDGCHHEQNEKDDKHMGHCKLFFLFHFLLSPFPFVSHSVSLFLSRP